MNYRRLGRTGLKVSVICLGSMQFGWTADADTSHRIMDAAVEAGCNFIDTADMYSKWAENSTAGRSETIIGEWIAESGVARQDVVLATKVRAQMRESVTAQGLSRHHVIDSVYRSLERLQTDYIDLYQLHWPDEETPIEETLEALTDLVREGLIHYIGCSNFPAWKLVRALWTSDAKRLASFVSLQPHYNLVHRAEFERELMAACLDFGVGVIPYSPLAGGFLTGKYRQDAPLPDSARAESIMKRYGNETGFATLSALDQVSQEAGATVAQTSLAWLIAQPTISSVIIGANTLGQLSDTLDAARVQLTEDQLETLTQASAWT